MFFSPASIYFIIPIILGVALSAGALYLAIRWFLNRKHFRELLTFKLIEIRLPFKVAEDPKKSLEEINLSSQLFLSLASKNIHFSLEIAVSSITENINFYLAVPGKMVETAKRILHGLWPDAQIDQVDDYNVFNPGGHATQAYLKPNDYHALPLRTYVEMGLDPFLQVLNNFTKLKKIGEGLALQVIVRTAPSKFKNKVSQYIYNLRGGVTLKGVLAGGKIPIKKKPEKDKIPEPEQRIVIDDTAIKMLEQKIKTPLLLVNYRVIASAENQLQAESILDSVIKSFDQFSMPQGNSLKAIKLKGDGKKLFSYIFRDYDAKQQILVNLEELASLVHLPTAGTNVPKINWIFSREASPPLNLPTEGTFVGNTKYRHEIRPVYITDEDRRRHVYVIGQTGTGKTNLIANMAYEDIKRGRGVGIIDPHGDVIENILALIPKERADDVILFDPGDLERPIGLNMLDHGRLKPEQKTFIVNEMQSIFNKLFLAETMGPMFEQYMRNTLQLLMEDEKDPATLIEVPRIFTDTEFRDKKLSRAINPIVLDFWEKEAVKVTGEASLSNMAPYITSKFNNFIANDYVRPIIGQAQSSFNFREVIDSKKILLVNLSKGKIGDLNAGLLGMIIVGRLLLAAFSRTDTPQEERQDFNLYIDEFQNFTTDSISTILSEARKYRLNLVVAHQFIAQLLEKIRDAVFGNVGSMIVFRIGATDAEFMEKYFIPVFNKNDFVNLPNYNAHAKLLIGGQVSQPFNIATVAAPKGTRELQEKIRELSRLKYGRPRKEVEEDIRRRLRD